MRVDWIRVVSIASLAACSTTDPTAADTCFVRDAGVDASSATSTPHPATLGVVSEWNVHDCT